MRLAEHAVHPLHIRVLATTSVVTAIGLGLVLHDLCSRDVATTAVSSAAQPDAVDKATDSGPERAQVHPSPPRSAVAAHETSDQAFQADEEEESGAGYNTRLRKEMARLDAMTTFLRDAEDPEALCYGCELLFAKGARSLLSWKISAYLERLGPLQREMREALTRGDEVAAESAYLAQYRPARQEFLEVLASRELFWLGFNGYLDRRTPQTNLTTDIFVRKPGRELKPEGG
jgi:hypothetical protein